MTTLWLREGLHVQACKGYKYTGIKNALDGSEDYMIVREAAQFWKDLKMRDRVNKAVHDVEVECTAGRLQWSYQGVYSLIAPFPPRGKLDVLLEFQDDEEVTAEGEDPWEEEAVQEAESLHGSGEEQAEAWDDGEELDSELDDPSPAAAEANVLT